MTRLTLCLLCLLAAGCGSDVPVVSQPGTPAPPPAAAAPVVQPSAPAPTTDQAQAQAQTTAKATHVVVLVIDGPRWSETFGEPTRQYIPHLATELAPQGAMWTDFANDGPTYTSAGHAAITTGCYRPLDNGGRELPANPGLFQLLVRSSGDPTQGWLITTKDKLAVLADCADPAWKGKWLCRSDCGAGGKGLGAGYRSDAETMQRVLTILPKDHPRFTLINLKEPDASGHAMDWPRYLDGIRAGDIAAKQLWDMLQQDPVFRGTTDFFITNDHGRHVDGHKDGYVSHGDDCAGCRKIMLVALGPDVRPGSVFSQHRTQIDLAVTVADILGQRLEASLGHRLDELWAAAP